MKVYGVNLDGKHRGIVAAKSWAEAARLLKTPVHRARAYGCVTANPEEIRIAMSEPGVVWRKIDRFHNDIYERIQPKEPTT